MRINNMSQDNKISLFETTNTVCIEQEPFITLNQSKIDHINSLLRRIKDGESCNTSDSYILNLIFFFASASISFFIAMFPSNYHFMILLGFWVSLILTVILCGLKYLRKKENRKNSSSIDELQVMFKKLEESIKKSINQ